MRSLQISNKGDRPWNLVIGSIRREWLDDFIILRTHRFKRDAISLAFFVG
jgi:hypothetical protein